jgi:hypothetical protein
MTSQGLCPERGLDGDTALPDTARMFEFIETPFFAKALEHYLDDDEYAELQAHLNKNPKAGVVVPESGGVRKLRWAAEGRGKRGGLRIIYFARRDRGHIWMLTIYGKNVSENIPAHLLRAMKKAIEHEEDD